MNIIKTVLMLFWKDFLVEIRRLYEIVSIIAFPVAGSVIFTILNQETSGVNALSFILIISLLATLFITTTSFIREYDKMTIYGLKSLPISASTLFIAKSIYTFLMVSVVSLVTVGSIAVFSSLPKIDLFGFIALLFLFASNLSIISALVSALTMYSEGKYVLIPLITTIYSFPIILLSSSIINKMLFYQPMYWELLTLLLHLIVFTTFSIFLSEIIMEE